MKNDIWNVWYWIVIDGRWAKDTFSPFKTEHEACKSAYRYSGQVRWSQGDQPPTETFNPHQVMTQPDSRKRAE